MTVGWVSDRVSELVELGFVIKIRECGLVSFFLVKNWMATLPKTNIAIENPPF